MNAQKSRRRLLSRLRRLSRPVAFMKLNRLQPLSAHWGYERGTPIDRYYIENFLSAQRQDIAGRVLEIMDSEYTDRYGSNVTARDVLDIDAGNPKATIIADLSVPGKIPSNTFDCFILTQTLQFISDTQASLAQAYDILKPGGVLLATVPVVSKLDRQLTDYWRFTPASCAMLFGNLFGPQNVRVESFGNVLTGIAFLAGLSAEELTQHELDTRDELYPMLVAVRAKK